MHARELVELAALAAVHGPAFIRRKDPIPACATEAYWVASKCRLDRWGRTLRTFAGRAADTTQPLHAGEWETFRAVLEEILAGEVLTRVWSAVLCAADRHRGTELVEPIARSVLIGHLEARHRVLTLLVAGPGIDAELAVKLNHLRRRTERWTDMLVAYLAPSLDIGEFAMDPKRAREFAEDVHAHRAWPGARHAWPLILGSLRAAFQQGLSPIAANADLNAAIASSVLCCFPAELFDAVGLPQSAWLLRLSRIASDTAGMIDELLAMDRQPPMLGGPLRRPGYGTRRFDT